ncbi:hypothetical protein [Cognatishimia activa]|uniref:hypothetical protein n=1 Tax=Cognatishimia activa TaxID=1715691 RepID=UPI00222F9484|nr:hypothetical protein [Cognatishimia activa]UZD91820.1 hypothetical protein M0D42_04160 [Cognatishimia activa]
MTPDILLIIGGTLALMLAVAAFVLTQKNAWKAILLLVALFGGLNIGAFIWSELLGDQWSSFRLFLFWIAALLPPLIGIGIGTLVGALVNWRISKVRPTYKRPSPKAPAPEKKKTKRQKPPPKPRIID